MAQHRDASKQTRWLNLMRLWQRSNLTIREFCDSRQLSQASFYAWRRTLRERGLIDDLLPSPQPSAHSIPPAATPTFVKLTLAAEPQTPSAVDLVLNERRLLRVRPGFDPATLLELVRLLEEPTC